MNICDDIIPPELIISNKVKNVNSYWFYTNKQFNGDDVINFSTFLAYRSSSELNKSLKRLYFKGDYADFERLKVNDFAQLEQLTLQIELNDSVDDVKQVHINLPNLRILEISRRGKGLHFNFESVSRLQKLKCLDVTAISLPDRNVINHLEQNLDCKNETIWPLKYVQYWKVNTVPPFEETIAAYPALTTLVCSERYYIRESSAMHNLFRFVSHKLEKPELKICFQSVYLNDQRKLEEYVGAGSILAFQIKNYDSLCGDTSTTIDYNELMKLCNGTLPDDFHQKFNKINSVFILKDVAKSFHFVEFLRSLSYVMSLDLNLTSFSQFFFDQLPEVCQIERLFISKCKLKITDWNFLLKMKQLRSFLIDQGSVDKCDMVMPMFKQLKRLRRVEFVIDGVKTIFSKRDNLAGFKRTGIAVREHFVVDFDQLERIITAYKDFIYYAFLPFKESFIQSKWMPADVKIEKTNVSLYGQKK